MNPSQIARLVLTGLLIWGAWLVLAPFVPSLIWAAILALVTWPVYQRIQGFLGKDSPWSALAMTLLLTLGVFLPALFFGLILTKDATLAYQSIKQGENFNLASLQNLAGRIPLVGSQLQTLLQLDSGEIQGTVKDQAGTILRILGGVGQEVSQGLIAAGLTIFSIFFFYLSGEYLIQQVTQALDRLGGEPLTSLLTPLTNTIKAVMLGLVITAIAQGFLTGVGFAITGVKGAVIGGVLAALISLIQGPTFLIWLPGVIWLGVQGQLWWQGAFLLVWGVLLISTIDNVLKPIFISQGTGLPFLLVFFGVLGGLLAFGSVGIVLGPVILSLLLVLWQRT